MMENEKNLEQRLLELRKRKIHSKKIFRKIGRLAREYVNSCSKTERKETRAKMMSYLESELPGEKDMAARNASVMYFNEFVGMLRRKGLPIRESAQVLDIVAADYAEGDSVDRQELDKVVYHYINHIFGTRPKLREQLIEFYHDMREHYSEILKAKSDLMPFELN